MTDDIDRLLDDVINRSGSHPDSAQKMAEIRKRQRLEGAKKKLG
jgi:hypothetical protein